MNSGDSRDRKDGIGLRVTRVVRGTIGGKADRGGDADECGDFWLDFA